MTKPVRPNAFAQDEIEYYIRWHEGESPGLGDRLWSDIQAASDLISRYPSIGNVVRRIRVRGGARRFPLHRFPFVLVYREREDYVELIALAHTSRKPNYWRSRLRS